MEHAAPITREILPVQFVMTLDAKVLTNEEACAYLRTSRQTLWRAASKHKISRNPFGNWNIEDLDRLRSMKRKGSK